MLNDEIKLKCIEVARDLCTNPKYKAWQYDGYYQADSQWFSVLDSLEKKSCPVDKINELPSDIVKNFIYACIKGSTYGKTGEVVYLFMINGELWHTLITNFPPPKELNNVLEAAT